MNTVTINGVTFTGVGSISINNNHVVIDGKDVTPDSKQVTISVQGDLEHLSADHAESITITGNVNSVDTMSGDVEIAGSVNGSVSTMSGDVDCGAIAGRVSTMSGDVRYR